MSRSEKSENQQFPENVKNRPGTGPEDGAGPPPEALEVSGHDAKALRAADQDFSTEGSNGKHGSLLEKSEKYGRIPVIVRLRLGNKLPGSEDEQQDKQEAIARIQEQVLDRLLESSTATREDLGVKTFKITPAFAMQANAEEIKALLSYPEVKDVIEDKPESPDE